MVGAASINLVASRWRPVATKDGKVYIRSKHSVQTSPRLRRFKACMRDKLKGTSPGTQAAAWSAFSNAAGSCSGQ